MVDVQLNGFFKSDVVLRDSRAHEVLVADLAWDKESVNSHESKGTRQSQPR